MTGHAPDDDCLVALENLQQFLHHELDEATEDQIRAHIDACDACLAQFDVEAVIASLVKRCCQPTQAPAALRMRVMRVSVTMQEPPYFI